jgi:hypothetical protein
MRNTFGIAVVSKSEDRGVQPCWGVLYLQNSTFFIVCWQEDNYLKEKQEQAFALWLSEA